MELAMCKELKWRLNPPTICIWSNLYTSMWDKYINEVHNIHETTESQEEKFTFVSSNDVPCDYRKSDD